MPGTVQLNVRIDPEVKRRGDAVFSRAGLSPSEVVRSVWSYAAREQTVPDFLIQRTSGTTEDLVAKIRSGAGMVQREAAEMGIALDFDSMDLDSLNAKMYDDMADDIHDQLVAP